MSDFLAKQIREAAEDCPQREIAEQFLARLEEGRPTRDENQRTHFCVYFLPFNPETRQVFIGDHKKSGLWLAPGGHIDAGEDLLAAANREIREELGVANFFPQAPEPFLLTITPIENERQTCKVHYDIWCLMETDGADFDVDFKEYHAVKWLSIPDARKYVTDSNVLKGLQQVMPEQFQPGSPG
ncbi:MAG: NUDIX hydrolase [Dehalococcoidia bacterium]